MIFVFVPWQVAYLGCWLLHLHTCASSAQYLRRDISRSGSEAVPLADRVRRRDGTDYPKYPPPAAEANNSPPDTRDIKRENANHNLHLLLLMTWLLPLTAPVLAVWVRTLLTAGYTTPFDGDHNFLAVLPFLVLTDFASWTPGALFEKAR
jgi:glycosylphosphatidylinositol deacylase